jgi:peptidoglycan/LPS O-acetylase OafA/YrhL
MKQSGHVRLDYIDVLRCIAILSVLLIHAKQYGSAETGLPVSLIHFIDLGPRGVQLFFMLSAFTIFLTMGRRKAGESTSLTKFFIRRFFRIAPLFYIAVIYFIFQNGLFSHLDLGLLISSIFFVNGISPDWFGGITPGGWIIGVEVLFYMTVPLLLKVIHNLKGAILLFFLSVIIKSLLQLLFLHSLAIPSRQLEVTGNFFFYYFPSQLPIFALGIVLFYLINEERRDKLKLFFLLSTPVLFLNMVGFPFIDTSLLLWGILFIGLSVMLRNYVEAGWVTSVTSFIGRVSYSIYFVHFAVLFWLNRVGFIDYLKVTDKFSAILNFGLRYALLCLIAIPISYLTYRFIEKPFIALGRRLIDKLQLRGSKLKSTTVVIANT